MKKTQTNITDQIRLIQDNVVMISNQLDSLKILDAEAAASTYLQILQYLEEKNNILNWANNN
jgi:hypothetical protein